MPKIQISEQLFYSLLGRKPQFAELEEELVVAKAEIDEEADEDGNLKIELNDTNRPDLWTVSGLARQLRIYKNEKLEDKFSFFSQAPDADKKIIVDKKLQNIRPYVLGFIVSGKKIDEVLLLELIQMQEKLCENFGQKRKAIAIGIYREDLIQWPVYYSAAHPTETAFVPLDFAESISLAKILKEHPKGKEYGYIIENEQYFPLLIDADNNVLSMPPIINSADIGAVKVGDAKLFIECTGTNLEQLMLATNIFACDCEELGFTITRIVAQYPYALEGDVGVRAEQKDKIYSLTAPIHFQNQMQVEIGAIHKMLGESLSDDEIQRALTKMNIVSEIKKDTVVVDVPSFRNDFLHSVDIIEDIIIGKGLNTLEPQYPQNFTIGRVTEVETMSRKIIQVMVGLGFQEMIYPYLGSKEDFIEKIYDSQDWDKVKSATIQISNPISENYELVRNSIIPNLLMTERVSSHSPYPHKICELGKVAIIDSTENLGTKTNTVLGFLIADKDVGFTNINSIMAAVFYYINTKWYQETLVDSRFIEGRACKIFIEREEQKIEVGFFGEVHPRVLDAQGITMPCVAGEIVIEHVL